MGSEVRCYELDIPLGMSGELVVEFEVRDGGVVAYAQLGEGEALRALPTVLHPLCDALLGTWFMEYDADATCARQYRLSDWIDVAFWCESMEARLQALGAEVLSADQEVAA